MFKEFEALKQAAGNIDSRVKALRSELESKKKEHAGAAAQYRQMMVDDSAGVKEYTTEQLNKAKMHADELASEVQVASERLEMVGNGRSKKLEAMIGDVRKGWRREADVLRAEITKIFDEAREIRAQLVMKMLEANKHYKKSYELRNVMREAQRLAGIEVNFNDSGVPEYVPTGWEDGMIPNEDEMKRAYLRGELYPHIQHYAETGELLTHEEWRQMKIAESNKKEEAEQRGIIGRMFSR